MKWSFLLIVAFLSILAFSGCKKSKQNKLTGSWELLPQTADQQDDTTIYTFDSENVVYIKVNNIVTDTGVYNLKSDFLKYYIDLSNLNSSVDANYLVEKLNKKIMVLQCESPYMRKEFTRHEE
jgi:hypothetical protein